LVIAAELVSAEFGVIFDMLKLTRFTGNPIISPRTDHPWESKSTFNPAAFNEGEITHILYRAVDQNGVSRLGYARSQDGSMVDDRRSTPVLEPSSDWEKFGCEDPRITKLDNTYYVTYTAYSGRGPRVALASTKDFQNYKKHGLIGPDKEDKDCVIFPEKIHGRIAILHRLESRIQIAYFENIKDLTQSRDYWTRYLRHFDDYEVIRSKYPWEERKVGVGPPPIKTEKGWLVIYHGVSIDSTYRTGAVLLDLDKPTEVLARTREPFLEPIENFEKHGVVPNVVFPDGASLRDGTLFVYYGGADKVCCVATAPVDELLDNILA